MSSTSARALRAMLTLAMLLSLVVVPATPAAAGTPSWTLTSVPAVVMRNGVSYRMSLSASDSSSETITMTLSKRKNPDGVAVATQTHTYIMRMSGNRFTHPNTNLSTAAIDTAADMGVYGKLDLTFAQNGPLNTTCGGHYRTRTGTLAGTVTFKTLTSTFDVIRVRPAKATLAYNDGACTFGGGGGSGGTPACPAPSTSLAASRFGAEQMSVFASRNAGARTSTMTISTFRNLKNEEGYLLSGITATLPASKVAIADNLRTATVSGSPGTWISGRGDMETPTTALIGEPTNCGTTKEQQVNSNAGTLVGTLKGDFWLGPDRSLRQGSIPGTNISRTLVRAR